jgi:hypothetical protein
MILLAGCASSSEECDEEPGDVSCERVFAAFCEPMVRCCTKNMYCDTSCTSQSTDFCAVSTCKDYVRANYCTTAMEKVRVCKQKADACIESVNRTACDVVIDPNAKASPECQTWAGSFSR